MYVYINRYIIILDNVTESENGVFFAQCFQQTFQYKLTMLSCMIMKQEQSKNQCYIYNDI